MPKVKSENDQRVLKLQSQIKTKKTEFRKAQKFQPVTNCSINFEGERYNINTLDLSGCNLLLVRLNCYQISEKDLKLSDPVLMSGYTLSEWITDLKSKSAHLGRKKEETKLKVMESKLKQLLSEDTRTELELEDIEKELGL